MLLPILAFPLGEADQIQVDYNRLSDGVYSSHTACSQRVEYEVLPLRLERYSAADQTLIRQGMKPVKAALRAEIDLEP